MRTGEALAAIYPALERRVVVTIMGALAAELHRLGHRPGFFYLEHAMGLASSLGLGIALALPGRQVIVLDGDGSLLMNLGTLATMARYRPANLLHLVFDNETLLSTGGARTATATGTDLAAMALAAGVPVACEVRSARDLAGAVNQALAARTLTTIVAKVEAVGPPSYHIPVTLLENRFQFWRHLETLRDRD